MLQRIGKYAVANKRKVPYSILLHEDAFAKNRRVHCFKDMNMRERTLRCRKEQESTLLQRTGNYPLGKEQQVTYTRNFECDQLQSPFEAAVSLDMTKSSYMNEILWSNSPYSGSHTMFLTICWFQWSANEKTRPDDLS